MAKTLDTGGWITHQVVESVSPSYDENYDNDDGDYDNDDDDNDAADQVVESVSPSDVIDEQSSRCTSVYETRLLNKRVRRKDKPVVRPCD